MLIWTQVSVHNGWKFVSEPHIVYLEPEYEGGKSGRKSPASQSSLRGTLAANILAPLTKLFVFKIFLRLQSILTVWLAWTMSEWFVAVKLPFYFYRWQGPLRAPKKLNTSGIQVYSLPIIPCYVHQSQPKKPTFEPLWLREPFTKLKSVLVCFLLWFCVGDQLLTCQFIIL